MPSALDEFANNSSKVSWDYSFLTSTTFSEFINLIPEAVIISNQAGDIVSCNDMACLIFGYSRVEFEQLTIEPLVPERIRDRHADMRAWFFDNPKPRYLESRNLNLTAVKKDQSEFPIDSALFAIHTDKGLVAVNLIRDISEADAERQQLNEYAFIDSLTNLPNRRYYVANLERTLARCKRHKHDCAMLFIDLDHFKPINDNEGHAIGDQVLSIVSQRLSNTVRQDDFLARIGGDEFVVLVYPLKSSDSLERFAARILESLRNPIDIDNQRFKISASIGICINHQARLASSTFTHLADKAMYRAKAEGGNSFRFIDNDDTI